MLSGVDSNIFVTMAAKKLNIYVHCNQHFSTTNLVLQVDTIQLTQLMKPASKNQKCQYSRHGTDHPQWMIYSMKLKFNV